MPKTKTKSEPLKLRNASEPMPFKLATMNPSALGDGSMRFTVAFLDTSNEIRFESHGWRLKDGALLPPQRKAGAAWVPTVTLNPWMTDAIQQQAMNLLELMEKVAPTPPSEIELLRAKLALLEAEAAAL